MNEINHNVLMKHGWTEELIKNFNLQPTSFNEKRHNYRYDNSIVEKIEKSQEFRNELIRIQKYKNLQKTLPQIKKIFRKMLFDKIEDDKFFELKCLYQDPRSENDKYSNLYIKELNKECEQFRNLWCNKLNKCESVEEISKLAKEMDVKYGEHFSNYL